MQDIHSCHLGPEISPEQYVPEHFFLYLLEGSMTGYDGSRHYAAGAGEACLFRKNYLVRYTKKPAGGMFEKIIIALDEPFLKRFQERHAVVPGIPLQKGAFLPIEKTPLIGHFIQSLEPYYHGMLQIDEAFSDLKREELLLILLRQDPKLADALFHFGVPEKLDLEAFMNRHFRFNIPLERFAFLTGRSLSAFKRDFREIYGLPPGQWLMRKRLDEAFFLLETEHRKPSDIYLDLGFEDLSHFSYAFRKQFGKAPTEVRRQTA